MIKTQPSRQWDVSRLVRERLKEAFDAEGIEIPFPQQTVWHRHADDGPGTRRAGRRGPELSGRAIRSPGSTRSAWPTPQRSSTVVLQCVSGRSTSSPSTVSVTASRSLKKHIACSIFGHSGHGAG